MAVLERSPQLTKLVNAELGRRINEDLQALIFARRNEAFQMKRAAHEDTDGVVAAAVEDVRAVEAVGGVQVGETFEVQLPDDPLWRLFSDLDATHSRFRAGQVAAARRDSPNAVADEVHVPLGRRSPIKLSVQPAAELTAMERLSPLLPGGVVTIEVDGRVGLDDLLAAVRKRYSEFRRQGLVRGKPRLRAGLELLRFVCLEVEPGLNWPERMKAWNESSRTPSFKHAGDFQMKFHRAEKSFAGSKRALDFFYDPTARMGIAEIIEAADGGDRRARARLKRITIEFQDLPPGVIWPGEPWDLGSAVNRALAEQAWVDGLRGEFAPSSREVILRDLSRRIVAARPIPSTGMHDATKEDADG